MVRSWTIMTLHHLNSEVHISNTQHEDEYKIGQLTELYVPPKVPPSLERQDILHLT